MRYRIVAKDGSDTDPAEDAEFVDALARELAKNASLFGNNLRRFAKALLRSPLLRGE